MKYREISIMLSARSLARIAPEIVRECAAKGAKAVHFCTAGFAETGDADVTELQQEWSRGPGNRSQDNWPKLHGHLLP